MLAILLRSIRACWSRLLLELLLDVRAEWHRTFVLLAALGMVAAEGNKLFADGASTIGFPFTAFVVLHDPLHLLA